MSYSAAKSLNKFPQCYSSIRDKFGKQQNIYTNYVEDNERTKYKSYSKSKENNRKDHYQFKTPTKIKKVEQTDYHCKIQNKQTNDQLSSIMHGEKSILNIFPNHLSELSSMGFASTQYRFQKQQNDKSNYIPPFQIVNSELLKIIQLPTFKNNLCETKNIFKDGDTVSMINQIERKALSEINQLKRQKQQLIVLLNKQIYLHNLEKKRRIQIQIQLNKLQTQKFHQSTQNRNNYAPNTQYFNNSPYLSSSQTKYNANGINNLKFIRNNVESAAEKDPIRSYKQKLIRAQHRTISMQEQISKFRNSAGIIVQSIPNLERLLEDGQRLRQETMLLIKKKASPDQFEQIERIFDLQRQIQAQQKQKIKFMQDLLQFKKNYKYLQQENKLLKGKNTSYFGYISRNPRIA